MIVESYPHTPEWNRRRCTGIGASHAGAVCGLDKYRQPLDVYLELTGQAGPTQANSYMRFGVVSEPAIVRRISLEWDCPLTYPMPLCRHGEWSFMLATPDAGRDDETGVEIKTMSGELLKQVQEMGLAATVPSYVAQVSQQMAVMGWSAVDLVIVSRTVNGSDLADDERLITRMQDNPDVADGVVSLLEMQTYRVERNERLINLIADKEAELWDRIQRREPPAVMANHGAAIETLRRAYPRIEQRAVRLTDGAAQEWVRYMTLGDQVTRLTAQRDACKAHVLAEIGSAAAGILPCGKAVKRQVYVSTVSLREVSGSGYHVQEPPTDTPASRLDKVRRYLGQRGWVGTMTGGGVARFLNIATGEELTIVIAPSEYNAADYFSEKNVIRLGDECVDPIGSVQQALAAVKSQTGD